MGKAYKKDRVEYRRSDLWVGQRKESYLTEDRFNKAFGKDEKFIENRPDSDVPWVHPFAHLD